MTNVAATTDCLLNTPPAANALKVAIVNGNPEMLELLDQIVAEERRPRDVPGVDPDAVPDAVGAQHVARFVDEDVERQPRVLDDAYSQIKRVQPNLVILCVRIDDAEGFQVLSMLKLDDETRGIPVLTYTTEYEGRETEEELLERSETELFSAKAAVWMN